MSEWISVEDRLPEDGKYVLIHVPGQPWEDCDDMEGLFYKIAKFERAEIEGNNKKPYRWKEFGPGSFFGQDVEYWMTLPEAPNE